MTHNRPKISVAVAARRLHCTPRNVYKLLDAGRLEGTRIGCGRGGRRVYEDSLRQFEALRAED